MCAELSVCVRFHPKLYILLACSRGNVRSLCSKHRESMMLVAFVTLKSMMLVAFHFGVLVVQCMLLLVLACASVGACAASLISGLKLLWAVHLAARFLLTACPKLRLRLRQFATCCVASCWLLWICSAWPVAWRALHAELVLRNMIEEWVASPRNWLSGWLLWICSTSPHNWLPGWLLWICPASPRNWLAASAIISVTLDIEWWFVDRPSAGVCLVAALFPMHTALYACVCVAVVTRLLLNPIVLTARHPRIRDAIQDLDVDVRAAPRALHAWHESSRVVCACAGRAACASHYCKTCGASTSGRGDGDRLQSTARRALGTRHTSNQTRRPSTQRCPGARCPPGHSAGIMAASPRYPRNTRRRRRPERLPLPVDI